MTEAPYPDPPWETHGFGAFCPYVVPRSAVTLPEGLEAIHSAGWCSGLLAYVRYEPPSPLSYNELIWMPTMVRTRAADGKVLRGWWVARMWVDSEASLRGGREIWALPKTLARFETHEGGVKMWADHGTEIVLGFRRLPRLGKVRSRMATVQVDGDRLVRFRASMRARPRPCHVQLRRLSSSDPELRSMDRGHRVAGLGVMLDPFDSTMHAPTVHPRRR